MNDKDQPSFAVRVAAKTRAPGIIRVPDNAVHALIHLEEGASAVVAGVVSDAVVDVVLEQGARLEVLRIAAKGATVFKARLAKDSSLRAFFYTCGGMGMKDDVHVALEGEGAEVFLNGLHFLSGDAYAESCTYVDHVAPHATSDQLYKSILRGRSHSVFNGRIMVRREAQLTNSYQLNKNLLLSREAKAETSPQLEIFADDVKCSHGAAVGQLDEDQLFYLQTRGVDRVRAGEMLIEGFIEDVLGKVQDPKLREEVNAVLGASRSVHHEKRI